MLQGGEPERTGGWATPRVTASAVACALAIAAVFAAAGVIFQTGGYSHDSFSSRVEIVAFLSFSAMGVVLAAAVALSCSQPTTRVPWRIWAYDALGVISVATVVASLWGLVVAFGEGTSAGLGGRLALERFGFATGELAPLPLAIAAILVIVRTRRVHSVEPTDAADLVHDSDGPAPAVFADGLVAPTIGCLILAGIVSLLVASTAGFARSTASAGDRIVGVAYSAGQITIAFIAFAVLVLVALSRNPRAREQDGNPATTAAGVISVVVAIAAVYSVYGAVVTKISPGGLPALTPSWWVRGGRIANALAAGTIALVAASLARHLHAGATEPHPRQSPNVSRLRSGARTTAALLAASSMAFAAYTVLSVLNLRDFGGSLKTSVSDLIAGEAQFVLIAAGLALASALVMAASRPDVTGHDTLNDVVDAVVGVIATAAVAVSGLSMCVVLSAHRSAQFSLFGGLNTAQRLGYAGTSLAAALIAAAALHLVARGRQIVADRETEREIERLDLLS